MNGGKGLVTSHCQRPLKINANNGVHWSWEVICNVDMKLDAPVANKRQGWKRYDPCLNRGSKWKEPGNLKGQIRGDPPDDLPVIW